MAAMSIHKLKEYEMGIFDIKNNNWKETLIRDLIMMSAMDNDIDPSEIKIVFESAEELGIPESRLRDIIKNPDSVKIQYPDNDEDKIKYFNNLIRLIAADNKVDKREVEFLYEIATKLGINHAFVKKMLSDVNQLLEDNDVETNKLGKYIEKKYNLVEGVLGNISNDLNDGMEKLKIDPEHASYEKRLIKMSYAYARRTAAAGLFCQGVFSRQDFQHAQKIFQAIQMQTIHTVEFQEEAADIAVKFLLSYDRRLTKELSSIMVTFAMQEDAVSLHEQGRQLTFDQLYPSLEKAMQYK